MNIFPVYHLSLHVDLDTQKYFMHKIHQVFLCSSHPEMKQILNSFHIDV